MRWPETLEQIHFLSTHHSKWEGQQDWRESQATSVEDGLRDDNPGARKKQKQSFPKQCGLLCQSTELEILWLGYKYFK